MSPGARLRAGALDLLRLKIVRAGDRTRTGDVQLGKLAFYQLNYARVCEPRSRRKLVLDR